MRCRYLFALFLGFGGASTVHADQLELFISGRAAQVGYAKPVGVSAADVSAALLYNEDDDLMLNGGLVVSGQPPGELPFSFGAGAKAYVFSLDDADEDVAAIPLGGRVAYTIPANIPLILSAEGFYAPAITAFGGADNMLDFNTRFEAEFIPRTSVFIGYRYLEVDLDDGQDVGLDHNFHVGLRLNF